MARSYEGITPIVVLPLERATSYAEIVTTWIVSIAQQGWAFLDPAYRRTDLARNMACYHLLDNPRFTHIVMLDMDHRHPIDIVGKLCRAVAEDPKRHVVSALTYRRGVPYEPIAWKMGDDGKLYVVTEWASGQVIEIDQCSPACTIISREIFEDIDPPWWAYTYHPEKYYYPTEDIYFSKLCRDNGFKQYVDTRIESEHLGVAFIGEDTFRGYMKLVTEEATDGQKGTS